MQSRTKGIAIPNHALMTNSKPKAKPEPESEPEPVAASDVLHTPGNIVLFTDGTTMHSGAARHGCRTPIGSSLWPNASGLRHPCLLPLCYSSAAPLLPLCCPPAALFWGPPSCSTMYERFILPPCTALPPCRKVQPVLRHDWPPMSIVPISILWPSA